MRYSLFICIVIIVASLSGCKGVSDAKILTGKDIISTQGMVVTAHPAASVAGAEILKAGGNAVDAAVAVEFALAVSYPAAGNIGGGGFMLYRMADGTVDMIDYREKAPLGATCDMFIGADGNVIEGLSTDTHLASGVPGTVDGMVRMHEKYGRLPFKKVIQPAIELAENGFVLTAIQAQSLNDNRSIFLERNMPETAFTHKTIWLAGDTLIQTDLAATLKRISKDKRDGFYTGETAEKIVEEIKRGGGLISLQDLTDYKSVFRTPLKGSYRDYLIYTVPPPSGGGIILLAVLKMVEPYNIENMGFHSTEEIHLLAEAEKRAFADRAEYGGDPDFINVPVAGLIDSKYTEDRMKNFNPEKAMPSDSIRYGIPEGYVSEETTHYSIVDKDGNAVAATTTLNGSYGNSIVVGGAGFLLNNEMDDFSVKPNDPNMYGLTGSEANAIAGGKRMLSSMTPVIVEKDGKLFLVAGSPGGSTIPTTLIQVIVNTIDYKMNITSAVDAPRFHHQYLPDFISMEEGTADSLTIYTLLKMGHTARIRTFIGSVNAVRILHDGTKSAGADIRWDNTAAGY